MRVVDSTIFSIDVAVLRFTFVGATPKNTMGNSKGDLLLNFGIVGFEAFNELIGFSVEGLKIENNIDDFCFFGWKLNFQNYFL